MGHKRHDHEWCMIRTVIAWYIRWFWDFNSLMVLAMVFLMLLDSSMVNGLFKSSLANESTLLRVNAAAVNGSCDGEGCAAANDSCGGLDPSDGVVGGDMCMLYFFFDLPL